MKIKNGFSNIDTILLNEINNNISSLKIDDDEAIKNIINNKNIYDKIKYKENVSSYIKTLREKESKRRKIVVVLTTISLLLLLSSLVLGFFSEIDFTLIAIVAGIISLFASLISTVISEKINKQVIELIGLKRTV